MEVIEDGNIMDRIPILLQRDLEYYQKNQTVLSETICRGVVGGRLDFPRNASFASVKIVLWLEEEFSIAFNSDVGVAKTSDPDKFVQLAIKSGDSLLEHLHMLAQEALDHADLPVLTATLGAAALLKNSLYCYVHHIEDMGNSERHSLLQSCYKRYVTMSEAVGERVLDLHNRILSLYILQDSGGRPIDEPRAAHEATPSVHGWWLYMNGMFKDLWDTVPPRMAQRIFAGMLNETLTILTVRYCQSKTTEATTPTLLNDILNILLCVAELLPCIATSGAELAGLHVQRATRDVRDVHCKCNQLFQCFAFNENSEPSPSVIDSPQPWFTFVNPKLFDSSVDDVTAKSTQDLELKTALGLELVVLLAQPQPSWTLLLMRRYRSGHTERRREKRQVRHLNACAVIEWTLLSHIHPVGGSVLLQLLTTAAYEEIQNFDGSLSAPSSIALAVAEALCSLDEHDKHRQQIERLVAQFNTTSTSTSSSFDGSLSAPSSIALAVAEALCSLDEHDKHTQQIERLVAQSNKTFKLSNKFGLEDFPDIHDPSDTDMPLDKAPLLYTMFHIGRRPFDQVSILYS
ncbi:Uncharacterized protein OBRU01_08305 [Operophtera brumata]|uniref:Uncharacterized protein n=1 Tax=Operophtera brumata TaxID=104452 RepID=A0A0L7LI87_OPEBR|nr:Uncharacterized protein OBRU01_08305 [Operophtera brumata]